MSEPIIIIEQLLSEAELINMDADDYGAVNGILNRGLAKDFYDYLDNPQANPKVKEDVNKYLGSRIRSLLFPDMLKEEGVVQAVVDLRLADIAEGVYDCDKQLPLLKRAVESRNDLIDTYPLRTKSAYDNYYKMITTLERTAKTPFYYKDQAQRLAYNKDFLFDKAKTAAYTGLSPVIRKQTTIAMAIRGIEYLQAAAAKGVDEVDRRFF